MYLLEYKYSDNDGWDFSKISFKNINLFVGQSGAGKSRLLNTIFNVAYFVATNLEPKTGNWDIKFKADEKIYRWKYKGEGKDFFVAEEHLEEILENGSTNIIFERNVETFKYNDIELPKLPKGSTGIFLLKEEELIAPVHKAFCRIIRRNFFGDELTKAISAAVMPEEITVKDGEWKKRWEALAPEIPLNIRMYVLHEFYKATFDLIVDEFRAVFPNIQNVQLSDGSKTLNRIDNAKMPLLLFKEKNIDKPYYLHEMSSGMQKVLLIIADVLSISKNSLYLIDEYENSLGVNAINFLPSFLSEHGKDMQFVITSHHPYLINNIPISNWSLFFRQGSNVTVRNGQELREKYGTSKQEAFIQLINDPEYGGVVL